MEYRVIGEWTSSSTEILNRMSCEISKRCCRKHNEGSSRISIENYVLMLLGTEEEDIESAEKTFREQHNKGLNTIRINPNSRN